jgi:flagellar protein FliO/FliZ
MMWRIWLFNLLLLCTAPSFAEPLNKKVNPNPSAVADSIGVGDYLQVFLGLIIVVVAIVAMAWMIKRMGHIQTRSHGALKIVGGIPLSQRERIILVQVGKQQLLFGVAPGNISTLHVLSEPIDAETVGQAAQGTFADRLQAMLKGERS